MKLPLPWGLALLAALWIVYAFLESQGERTALLIVAMGVALWTAFSLNIPARRDEPADEQAEQLAAPPDDESEGSSAEERESVRGEGDSEGGSKPG